MILSPCKDCPDRHMRCHVDCEKYGQFLVENEKRKKFNMNKISEYEDTIRTSKRISDYYKNRRRGGSR